MIAAFTSFIAAFCNAISFLWKFCFSKHSFKVWALSLALNKLNFLIETINIWLAKYIEWWLYYWKNIRNRNSTLQNNRHQRTGHQFETLPLITINRSNSQTSVTSDAITVIPETQEEDISRRRANDDETSFLYNGQGTLNRDGRPM